jgi:predicted metal-dependent HD superfamily phosphohydrolase
MAGAASSGHAQYLGELKSRWKILLQRVGVSDAGKANDAFNKIVSKYSESHRHYHNLKHVYSVLAWFNELKSQTQNPDATELALWLHDVVYDPKLKNNEEQSALFAKDLLSNLGVNEAVINRVEKLVLCTKDHEAPQDDVDAQVLLDLDLAIFGATELDYQSYKSAIRAEYAHVWSPVYRLNRNKLLKSFLKRKNIYSTELMRRKLENQARLNIANEIG